MRTEKQRDGTGNVIKNRATSPPPRVGIAWRVAVCLLIWAGSLQWAHAATSVCGTVSGTWTSNDSPYLVSCDIQVATLNIQPGVEIRFLSNYVFYVAGVLKANGTLNNPIVFTTTNAAIGWGGIFFDNAGAGCELAHCIVERSVNSGIRIASSSPAISDCVIRSNTVLVQAGYSLDARGAGIKSDSPLSLDNCVIQNNWVSLVTSVHDPASATAIGGGIYSTAPVRLRNCTISGNSVSALATTSGNGTVAAVSKGGGVFISGTNLTLLNCTLNGNSAAANARVSGALNQGYTLLARSLGGGICSEGTLGETNTFISANTVSGGSGSSYGWASTIVDIAGGGAYTSGSSAAIVNCSLALNNPSGVVIAGNGGTIVNCTFASNSVSGLEITGNGTSVLNCTVAFNGQNGLKAGSGDTTIMNSVLWGNSTSQVTGTTNVTYSDVQAGLAGQGNIDRNPIFMSDLSLAVGSPCIDAGNPAPAYNDVCLAPCGLSLGTVTNDMGAYGGPGACGWTSPCAPTITTEPQDQSGCLSHSATFSVKATGTGSLSYQWYFNTNTLILNATNANLTLMNLQGTNAGKYSVVVSSLGASVTSAMAQLTLYDPYTELEVEWYFDAYMGAGLNIAGRPGATYVLKYTTDPRNINWTTWTPLATNTMGSSGWFFYLDEESPYAPYRFYQARLKP